MGWVLFDGDCGICAMWVPRWAPRLARIGLGVRPLQDPEVRARLGVGEDALLRDIRLLFADGSHLSGAAVYRFVLRRIWWGYPLYLLSIVPGLRWLFDRAYRGVADNRQRISSACGLGHPRH